jgi:hypothetical protein
LRSFSAPPATSCKADLISCHSCSRAPVS